VISDLVNDIIFYTITVTLWVIYFFKETLSHFFSQFFHFCIVISDLLNYVILLYYYNKQNTIQNVLLFVLIADRGGRICKDFITGHYALYMKS
jgi:hypothetical protein